ncbi:MAG: hypothetical protein OK442_02680 [Thaumarchaeota archaeon]|nr:hypothetical protein [Nitrososphaerota archaeon]
MEGRSNSNLPVASFGLPTIWFTPRLGYQLVPDDITNSISIVVVAVAIYYAVKIIRLSDKFDYVALKGGRAPYYIVLGMIFLELDRIFDLLTIPLSWYFGYQWTVTFNDPPAALAGLFIALGLREMYVVYIRNSKAKKPVPSHEEIWETEKVGAAA